jgi:hypothetical protein
VDTSSAVPLESEAFGFAKDFVLNRSSLEVNKNGLVAPDLKTFHQQLRSVLWPKNWTTRHVSWNRQAPATFSQLHSIA